MSRIYLSVPHMGDLEQRYVAEAFASNWLSSVGPNLDAFEAEFSRRVGGQHCVAVSSGTAALHLGLRLLGVGPGDEVVCPTLTFVATANAIVLQGATPVLVDSERRTFNLCPERLADALAAGKRAGRLPKAVVIVHLYGQTADLDALRAVCAAHDVPIVEDAAEALGTLHRGTQVGTSSPVSIFSFNGNKIITTTGGGMLVTPSEAWAKKARFWSQQARDPGIAYEHTELGYNYRMSNVLAGIGRGQLAVLDERVAARRRNAFAYREAFADVAGLELMPQSDLGFHTNWLSVFLVDEPTLGVSRDALIDALAREDIEARPVWKPMHLQPLYASAPTFGGEVAEDLFRRGICFPSSSSLSDAERHRVVEVVRRTVGAGAPKAEGSA